MVLWIIVFLFFLFIGLLLWTPLRLIIDSTWDVYRLEWHYLGSAMLIENDDSLGVQIQFLFFKKIIPFEVLFKKIVKPTLKKQITKTPSPYSPNILGTSRDRSVSKPRFKPKLIPLLRSFKIKKLKVNWDTDNYILNAYLFPITPFFANPDKFMHINFQGKRDIELIIENRVGRILKSFF